jgi:hypothetical protein
MKIINVLAHAVRENWFLIKISTDEEIYGIGKAGATFVHKAKTAGLRKSHPQERDAELK